MLLFFHIYICVYIYMHTHFGPLKYGQAQGHGDRPRASFPKRRAEAAFVSYKRLEPREGIP